MNRFAAPLCALLALFCVTSCGGDTHEKAAQDVIGVMDEFADVLGDITDKESAEANKSKLEDLVEKMKAIDERMTALGDPTEEQEKAMSELEGAKDIPGKLMQEMLRLSGEPDAIAIIQSTLEEMQTLGN